MNKTRFGSNSAENFIDDYLLHNKMRIPSELRQLLIIKLEEEEARLLAPLIKEIADNHLTDEDDATYFAKLEDRVRQHEQEDLNRPRYKALTDDDKQIMTIHKKDVNGVVVPPEDPADFGLPKVNVVRER